MNKVRGGRSFHERDQRMEELPRPEDGGAAMRDGIGQVEDIPNFIPSPCMLLCSKLWTEKENIFWKRYNPWCLMCVRHGLITVRLVVVKGGSTMYN